jgi:hypothetical protein
MSYLEIIDSYNNYYNAFKLYPISQLLDMCEQNKLSIYGDKIILVDRLALHYSKKNEPNNLYKCINSIKQIFFNS